MLLLLLLLPHLLPEPLTRGTTLRANHLSSAKTCGEAVTASQRTCTAGSLHLAATATTPPSHEQTDMQVQDQTQMGIGGNQWWC
jgi:hypothetical protein